MFESIVEYLHNLGSYLIKSLPEIIGSMLGVIIVILITRMRPFFKDNICCSCKEDNVKDK